MNFPGFPSKPIALIAIFATLVAATSHAQEVLGAFVARVHTSSAGLNMPYRLFTPAGESQSQSLPLIVYLHGSGGAGTDNLRQISGGNTAGTHVWTTVAMQAKHPTFVVAPQIPAGARWSAAESDDLARYANGVLDLIADLSEEFSIDPDRIYLVGQSLGGYGTWDIVSKRPRVFAAAVPLCGAGDPSRILSAKDVAVWAFHGAKDTTVPVEGSRKMVAALRSVGSPVRYTEYPDVGHDVWTVAFADPELPEWLFAQRRSSH